MKLIQKVFRLIFVCAMLILPIFGSVPNVSADAKSDLAIVCGSSKIIGASTFGGNLQEFVLQNIEPCKTLYNYTRTAFALKNANAVVTTAQLKGACVEASSISINLPQKLSGDTATLNSVRSICSGVGITIGSEADLAECNFIGKAWDFLISGGINCGLTENRNEQLAKTPTVVCQMIDKSGIVVASQTSPPFGDLNNTCKQTFNYTGLPLLAVLKQEYQDDQQQYIVAASRQQSAVCTWVSKNIANVNIVETQKSKIKKLCEIDESTRQDQANQNNPSGCTALPTDVPGQVGCLLKGFVNFFAQGLTAFLAGAISLLAYFMAFILNFIVAVLGFIANELLLINPASNQYIGVSREVFGLFSNLVNLVILFLFVKTGFDFIFNDKKSPDLSNFIIQVATIAIGVQFSFAIAAAIMALSYNIGYIFLQTIDPGSINPFASFVNAVDAGFSKGGDQYLSKLGTYFTEIFNGGAPKLVGALIGSAAIQLSRVIILLFAVYLFIQFIIKFVTRAATMFFLLITAPIGFVFFVAKDLDDEIKKFGTEWWKSLIANSLTYPVIVIALGIGARLVTQIQLINTGQEINVDGLDIFDPATYSIIIAPLIRAVLPGLIALGTLALLDQWIETNLKPMAGGLTSRILKGVSSGARSVGQGVLRGNDFARRGLSAGIRTGAAFSSLGQQINNLAGRGRAGFSGALKGAKENGIKGVLSGAGKAIRDGKFKSLAQVSRENNLKGIRNAASAIKAYDSVTTAEGAFNPIRRFLPIGAKFNKNGSLKTVKNDNPYVIEQEAQIAAGNAEQAHYIDFELRKNANTEADIAYADQVALKNKIRSPFTNKGAADLKLMGLDKAQQLMELSMKRQSALAAGQRYGFRGNKDSAPDQSKVRSTIEKGLGSDVYKLDAIDEDGNADFKVRKEAEEAIEKSLTSDTQAISYILETADNPEAYSALISSSPALKKYFYSKAGLDFMRRQLGDEKFAKFYQTTYSAANGLLGFSQSTIDEIGADQTFDDFSDHLQNQFRNVVQNPEKASQRIFNDSNALEQIFKAAEKTNPAALARIADKTGRVAFGSTTEGLVNAVTQAKEQLREQTVKQISQLTTDLDAGKLASAGGIDALNTSSAKVLEAQNTDLGKLTAGGGFSNSFIDDEMDRLVSGVDIYAESELQNQIKAEIKNIGAVINATGQTVFSPETLAYSKPKDVKSGGIFDTQLVPVVRNIAQKLASGATVDQISEFVDASTEEVAATYKTISASISNRPEFANDARLQSALQAVSAGQGNTGHFALVNEALAQVSDQQISSTLGGKSDIGEVRDHTGQIIKPTGKQVIRKLVASLPANQKIINDKLADMESPDSGFSKKLGRSLRQFADSSGATEQAELAGTRRLTQGIAGVLGANTSPAANSTSTIGSNTRIVGQDTTSTAGYVQTPSGLIIPTAQPSVSPTTPNRTQQQQIQDQLSSAQSNIASRKADLNSSRVQDPRERQAIAQEISNYENQARGLQKQVSRISRPAITPDTKAKLVQKAKDIEARYNTLSTSLQNASPADAPAIRSQMQQAYTDIFKANIATKGVSAITDEAVGQRVNIARSSGDVQNDWIVASVDSSANQVTVIRRNPQGADEIKNISTSELIEQQLDHDSDLKN